MTKVSPRIRERAAILCSAAASYGNAIGITGITSLMLSVDHTTAVKLRIAKLAVRAWDAANRRLDDGGRRVYTDESMRADYAEAEALLRTGWSP